MALATPSQRSTKDSFVIIEFSYGDGPTFVRFTDSLQDETVGGDVYTSLPTLAIQLPPNGIGLDDKFCKIAIPLIVDGFTDNISSGEAHAEVKVVVKEVIEAAGEQDIITLFLGRVITGVRNYRHTANLVLIKAKGVKSRLEVPMGLPANHHCAWPFGQIRTCGIDAPAFGDQSVEITDIDAKTITVQDVLSFDDLFYHRGFVLFDGLRISIRDSSYIDGGGGAPPGFGQAILSLVKEPPASWLNASVDIIPGCDKTIETCRARWNNESRFMGMGYGVPAHHGVIEDTLTDLGSQKGAPYDPVGGDHRNPRPCV